MSYKKTYVPKQGYSPICRDGDTTFSDLRFGIIELKCGENVMLDTEERETAFIVLGGIADFSFDGQVWKSIGGRRTVFEGTAHAVYMPRRKSVTVTTPWSVKIAVCSAPVSQDTEPMLVKPDIVRKVLLGVKPWERETHFIIDETKNSKRLFVGEAFVTPGNWAGFPPHKHDERNMPDEDVQEELYYFLFQPEQGFAMQALYTKDREIDESYIVRKNELVELPRGYHTTVGAPGYNTYFLWASSCNDQGMFRSSDPDHSWIHALENDLKKRR